MVKLYSTVLNPVSLSFPHFAHYVLVIMVVTFASSQLLHSLVERPAQSWLRQFPENGWLVKANTVYCWAVLIVSCLMHSVMIPVVVYKFGYTGFPAEAGGA